jgi:O-acetyl-ADP-ribose deacetylase (regulator of RNase III)
MSIHFVKGDMLEAKLDYYCHQVNCQGRMASGIAKSIKTKWHRVYDDYIAKCDDVRNKVIEMCGRWESHIDVSEVLLGDIQLVPVDVDKTVVNMFAQQYYGYDGKRYTSYDGFWSCLGKIREQVPKGSKIGFPDHIGCGLGGANWEVIKTMIWEALSEDYDVYIYKLEA